VNILPLRDGDWYRVAIDWPGQGSVSVPDAPASVTIDGVVPENLDVAFRLVDADQRDLTG
jgi:hypothetical protein